MGINVTDPSATALTVAASGTNYGLQIDESATSAATGVKVTAKAAGAGVALSTLSPNSNENLIIDAKGSGTVSVSSVSTGSVILGTGGGNVGIGTTTPAHKLHVAGDARATGNMLIGGNVGIGTTAPDAYLNINTTGTDQLALHVSSGSGGRVRFEVPTIEMLGRDPTINIGDYFVGGNDPRIDFYSSGGPGGGVKAVDVRILSPGQGWDGVGNGLLRFLAKIVETRYIGTDQNRRSLRLRIDHSNSSADPRYTGIISLNNNDGGNTVMEFSVADSELEPGNGIRLKIDGNAHMTLGTHIQTTNRVLKFRDSNGSSIIEHQSGGGLRFSTDNSDLSPGDHVRLRIDSNNFSASSALYTAADGKTLTTTAPSGQMYKESVTTFEPDLTKFYELTLRAFTWTSTGERDFGILAEDIQSCLPELFRDDGFVTGWKADRFPFYLFQALKVLKRRVDTLEQQNEQRRQ